MSEQGDSFSEWLKSNPIPDLQELVAKFGGYDKITAQAWDEHDAAMAEWQAKRKLRLVSGAA